MTNKFKNMSLYSKRKLERNFIYDNINLVKKLLTYDTVKFVKIMLY